MKKAFTMIELIFIIVIIGILAAVAIPKLTATRDDAKVSAMANTVVNAANEIAAKAVSSGVPSSDMEAMSDIVKVMITQNKATLNSGVLSIKMNTVIDCLKLTVVSSSQDMNLTLTYGDAGTDAICLALQNTIDEADYPMQLKGTRIKF